MNLLLIVRQSLGLNQEAMANLLGISLALLKKAETNQRNLPAASLQRLISMHGILQELPENKTEKIFATDSIADLLHKTKKKKRLLDKAIEKASLESQQMQNRLLVQTALLEKFPPENYPAEASQINALGFEAQSFLQQDDSENDLHLLAQQAGLAAMIDFLERQVALFET